MINFNTVRCPFCLELFHRHKIDKDCDFNTFMNAEDEVCQYNKIINNFLVWYKVDAGSKIGRFFHYYPWPISYKEGVSRHGGRTFTL